MNGTIKVCDIEKYYGTKDNITKAVNRISFEVRSGEFVGVMGASGSGKTTLLNLMSTIDKVTSCLLYTSIETAVREVMAYDVDGIHFDDYFYHAKKGYKNRDNDKILKVSQDPSASKKRSNVNQMVKSVYRTVKSSGSGAVFGISPQGNIENCRSAGADVDKWLSSSGYIDYIIPQIYCCLLYTSRCV